MPSSERIVTDTQPDPRELTEADLVDDQYVANALRLRLTTLQSYLAKSRTQESYKNKLPNCRVIHGRTRYWIKSIVDEFATAKFGKVAALLREAEASSSTSSPASQPQRITTNWPPDTTDLLRGEIPQVSPLNFPYPNDPEPYVNLVGRTVRPGWLACMHCGEPHLSQDKSRDRLHTLCRRSFNQADR